MNCIWYDIVRFRTRPTRICFWTLPKRPHIFRREYLYLWTFTTNLAQAMWDCIAYPFLPHPILPSSTFGPGDFGSRDCDCHTIPGILFLSSVIYGICDKSGALGYFYWSVMSYRLESDIRSQLVKNKECHRNKNLPVRASSLQGMIDPTTNAVDAPVTINSWTKKETQTL